MDRIIGDILKARVIGIVRLANYDCAIDITKALKRGGMSVMEFTLTGSGAFEAVRRVKQVEQGVRVGVGSVRSADQVTKAYDSGAEFIVTPAFVPEVVKEAVRLGIVSVVGALTPTEMVAAANSGADFIKVFPARSFGPSYLKDILAPLPDLRLIPTGGVDQTNAKAFLDAGAVAVAIGGSLVNKDSVINGDFDSLTNSARRILEAIGGVL